MKHEKEEKSHMKKKSMMHSMKAMKEKEAHTMKKHPMKKHKKAK